jgi:3-hydroxymyristoyl/3-hydroxydecanoyl-(acyl carrier protein) dehydratase
MTCQTALLDAAQIQSLIPHREPFLFVQSAIVVSDTQIQGVAIWKATHPILQGHFPSQPVVPGVCQIEACAQLAGVLMAWNGRKTLAVDQEKTIGVLGAIRQAKFQNMLLPNQALHITCELRAMSESLYLVKATGQFEGAGVMNCEFVIGLRTAQKTPPVSVADIPPTS